MPALHTAKRATAETANALRNSELIVQLDLENTPSDNNSQQETILGAALRKALARKAEARS